MILRIGMNLGLAASVMAPAPQAASKPPTELSCHEAESPAGAGSYPAATQATFAKARAACREGRGYTVK